jgi:type IV secretion system protein VirB2
MSSIKLFADVKAAFAANSAATADRSRQTLQVFAIVALAILAMSPAMALAAPWDSTAEKVLEIFTGGMARTLAIIAVIACGIAAVAGKLSWDWAIKIIIGIVLIFGATAIVDYMIAATA